MFEDDIPEGFQLDEGSHGETDITQQWLDAAEAKLNGELSGNSPDPAMGGATAADLQHGRFSHLEPRIQKGIQSALYGTLDSSAIYKRPVEMMAAREAFENVTGVKASKFASQMVIDESVEDPRSRQDLATVFSVLNNTAGEYLEKGPGSKLAGHSLNEEKQLKKEEGLSLAFTKLDGLADLYIPDEVRESNRYGIVKEQVTNQLTSRLMDEKFFKRPKDAKGWMDSPILPLPSELNVRGLKETGSAVYGSTSPHTRLSWQGLWSDKKEAEKYTGYELKQLEPSLINSLFPIAREDRVKDSNGKNRTDPQAKRKQEFDMNQAYKSAQFIHEQFREAFPTLQNESEGVKRATGFTTVYDDQARQDSARNEALLLDLDTHQTDFVSSMSTTMIDAVGKGSDKGGMYGEKNSSEVSRFVSAIGQGLSTEHALDVAAGDDLGAVVERAANEVPEFDLSTDRGRYLEKTFFNPPPKQGTKEWLNQRKGNITASIAGELLGDGAETKMAIKLAEQNLGIAQPFVANSYTAGGNKYEDSVRRAFMATAGKNLDFEEAYFETNKDHEGFGVSPDGRLFNKDGSSAGLLELKYLTGKSMKNALNKYTPQMQMQMAIAGEEQTHFYAMNKHTGEYLHEIVKADPEMQKKLLETGEAAQSMAKANSSATQVVAMEKQMKQKREAIRASVEEKEPRKEAVFDDSIAEEDVRLPAFSEDVDILETGRHKDTPAAAATVFGKMLKKEAEADENKKAKARVHASVEGADDTAIDEAFELEKGKFVQEAQKIVSKEVQKEARASFKAGNIKPNPLDDNSSDGRLANHYRLMEADDKRTAAADKVMETEAIKENKEFDRRKAAEEKAMLAEASYDNKVFDMTKAAGEKAEADKVKARNAQIDKVEKAYQEDFSMAKAENAYRDAVQASIKKADDDAYAADVKEAYATNKYMDDVEAITKKNEEKKAKEAAQADKAAQEELDKAAREASKSLQDMSDSAKQALGVLVEIGGLVLEGNKSGMDEVRLAAETGMDVSATRGMRKALEMGGMDASGINSTFGAAAGMVGKFNNEATAAAQYTELMKERGVSNLESVRNLDLPSFDEFKGMNPQQLIGSVAEMMEGKSPEERAQIGRIFGMTSLTANQTSAEDILNASDVRIDESGLRDTNVGIQTVNQEVRAQKENAGSMGEMAGMGAAGVGVAGAVLGSKMMGAAKGSNMAGKLATAAKAGKGAQLAKGLSLAAKATPIAAAATVAPMVARELTGIEDDGGVGDSLMDIAEFTAYGAAAGSVVPVVGTAVGAAAGAAVGVANEAYEYFTKEAVPDKSIGTMKASTESQPVNVDNNVEVNVEIQKDKYQVNTRVNGAELIDEGTGLDT